MLKFVYFQILIQFRTYIYYSTNLFQIHRDKYLTVRKISTRPTQKIQIKLTRLDAARQLCIDCCRLQSQILHTYPSPPRTALVGWVWYSPAPGTTTQAGPSSSQTSHHQHWLTSSWSFSSGQQHTNFPLLLTWARWLACWYDASCPCTLVCYFCTYLLA